jgi:hypothetical protein
MQNEIVRDRYNARSLIKKFLENVMTSEANRVLKTERKICHIEDLENHWICVGSKEECIPYFDVFYRVFQLAGETRWLAELESRVMEKLNWTYCPKMLVGRIDKCCVERLISRVLNNLRKTLRRKGQNHHGFEIVLYSRNDQKTSKSEDGYEIRWSDPVERKMRNSNKVSKLKLQRTVQ